MRDAITHERADLSGRGADNTPRIESNSSEISAVSAVLGVKTPEQQAVAEQQSFKVAQTTQALPAPAGNGPGTKITANASGVVVLPSDAKIATIQASGGDLRIVLEDGRVFIVEGGVANPPSIQIDGQTILGSSLASVFGPIQEVQPAAGDASPPSSGSNFNTPTGSIDQAFEISGLLGTDAANASGDGDDDSETPFFDDVPVVNAQTAFTIDEDGIDGQSSEGTSGYTGQLDIAYGVNGANLIAPITFDPTTLTGFTSGGDPVVFTWDQASLTLTGSVNGNPVFVLQVTDPLTGAFTATLSGPFDHNGAGRDGLPISLPFVVRDGNGTETPGVLSFTVNDDVPVAQDISGAMNENDTPIIVAVEGLGADFYAGADGLGSISLDSANATIVGPEGIVLSIPGLALVPASSTQFELAITPGSAFDVLAAGETATLTIPYVVVDGDGDSVTGNFIVTITGQNDGPVAVAVAGAASEDGPSITVTANFSDIDVSDTHTFTVNAAETQGSVTNNNDGTFTYVANGAYEYLAAGETATDTFTYTVTDNNGASSTATVTITITGQNDGPVALAVAGGANEDGPSVTVSANYSDLDASDTHTFTVNTTGTQGSVTNNSDGTFTYSPNAAFEALAAGETATDTFTYTVTDNNGASSTATVTITITGQNDGPVALAVAGGANEDGPSVTVSADYSDLDTSDTHTFTVNTTGTQGSVTNNNDGTFTYVANGAYEYLAAGETATDTFTYTVTDNNGASSTATVTITITGQNDGPVALAVAGGANEDGPSVTVSANYSDLDASDTHTFTVNTTGTQGSVTNNSDGTFTYSPNAAFEALAVGETATDTFTYTVTDNNGASSTATVTITITGTNDAPVISVEAGNSAAGSLTETNATIKTDGTLTVSDVDVSDAVAATVTGVSWTLSSGNVMYSDAGLMNLFSVSPSSILSSGGPRTATLDWNFDSKGNAFNFLGEGVVAELHYTVRVTDSSGAFDDQVVTITITGTNDIPVITGAVNPAGTTEIIGNSSAQDINLVGGTLTVSDADRGDTLTPSVAGDATATLNGGALPSGVDVSALIAANAVQFSAPQVSNSGARTFTWSYDPVAADLDWLAAGEVLTIRYVAQINDGHVTNGSQELLITITGTNDAPVISIPAGETTVALGSEIAVSRSLTETNAALTANGTLTVNDVDDGSVVTAQVVGISGGGAGYNIADALGFLTVAPGSINDAGETPNNLAWTFNSGVQNFDFLRQGFQVRLTYTIRVTDQHGATDEQLVTVLITGTNDAPVISIPAGEATVVLGSETAVSRSLTETNAALTANGTLTVNDVDDGSVVTAQVVGISGGGAGYNIADALGFLTVVPGSINDAGETPNNLAWTFNSGAQNFDFLRQGFQVRLTYTIRVTDQHGATDEQLVTVLITGTNDAPVAQAVTGAVNEDGPSVLVTANYADVDNGDTHSFSVNTTGTLGSVTNNGNGTFTYAPNGAFEYLAVGETATDTFTYTVTDNNGASSTQTATITITGTNDAPVVTAGTGSITELAGQTLSVAANTTSGSLSFIDPDLNDVGHTATVISVARGGESDGLPGGALGTLYLRSLLNLGAVVKDAGDADGHVDWTFSAPDLTFDYLAKGQVATLTYTIRVNDGDGGTHDQTLTISIVGTNDQPVFLASAARVGLENLNTTGSSAAETFSGVLAFTDPDRDDVGHTATVTGFQASGTVTGLDTAAVEHAVTIGAVSKSINNIGGTVSWSFSAEDRAFDYLAAGEAVTLTYQVTLNDGEGEANSTGTTTVSVTIFGTNDRPVITTGNLTPAALSELINTVDSNTTLERSGTFNFSDADLTDTHTTAASLESAVWSKGTIPATTLAAIESELQDALQASIQTGDDSTGTGTGKISWQFALEDKYVDFLANNETLALTYKVMLTDDSNASNDEASFKTVTITITGKNDQPVLEAATQQLDEKHGSTLSLAANMVSGVMAFSDVDLSDTHTANITSVARSGETDGLPGGYLGNLALLSYLQLGSIQEAANAATGTIPYTFSAPDARFDYLSEGQHVTLTYTVRLRDGKGGESFETIAITVNGTNDKPVFVAGDVRLGVENVNQTGDGSAKNFSGLLLFGDADRDDTNYDFDVVALNTSGNTDGLAPADLADLQNAVSGIATKAANSIGGTVSWNFSAPDSMFDYLASGETLTLAYTVQIDDNRSEYNTDTTTIYITIIGTNDRPVIVLGGSDSAEARLTEFAGELGSTDLQTAAGTLTLTDVDLSDSGSHSIGAITVASSGVDAQLPNVDLLSFFQASVTTATVNGTGQISWTFEAPDGVFDYLRVGEELVLTYTFSVSDGGPNGTSTPQSVVIYVKGTNDVPVVTAVAGATDEDGGTALAGLAGANAGGTGDINAGTTASGSLNIVWGPDDYTDGGDVAGSVKFAGVTSDAGGASAPAGTSRGEEIKIYIAPDGSRIIGYVGDDPVSLGGDGLPVGMRTVFVAEIDEQGTGSYTFTLLDVVDHPVAGTEDNVTLSFSINVTDTDNAVVPHELEIVVNDDMPTLRGGHGVRETVVSESGIGGAQGAGSYDYANQPSSNPSVHYGADGFGSTAFTGYLKLDVAPGYIEGNVTFDLSTGPKSTPKLTSGGEIVVFEQINATTIIGYVGNSSNVVIELKLVNSEVTATLHGALDHISAHDGSSLDTIIVDARIVFRDGDGDSVESIIRTRVSDDAPTASLSPRLTLTESTNPDGTFKVSSVEGNFTFTPGADGAAVTAISISLTTSGPVYNAADVDASTFTRVALKSGGVPIIVTNDNDLTLVGRADGVEIFRVEVIDPATGRYRFTQSGPIDHPDANESGTADGLRLRVDFVVTDGDGDTATAHVQLDINDSAPTASLSPRLTLTESTNPGGTFKVSSVEGNFTFTPGADGAAVTAISISLTTAGPVYNAADVDAPTFTRVALKSGGVPIIVTNDNDLTLVGRADGVEIFRVEVLDPATGRYRFTQSGPIDHPDVNESGTADGLRLRVDFVVTDGDGDTATAHVQLDINDSAPTALAVAIAGNEDALIEVVLNADGGADGLQGYVIKSLPANGKLYSDAAGTAEIAANQTVTGPVYFKPGAQWHGQTTFGYAAIDGDNDQSATVLATINVAAINDAPVLANVQNVSVAEDNVLYLSGLSNKWVASDPDQGDGKTPSVTLTLHVDSGDAVLSAARGGLSGSFNIVVSDGGKTLTITTGADGGAGGRDAYAILNTLLRGDNFAGNNNGIAVTPGPDFNGDVQISWTLNDNGNFGAGGAQTDSGSFTVTVTPVNDAPVIGLGGDTGSVIEPGDPAFIQEAGAGHPSSGGGLGLEPTSSVDAVLAPHIVSGMSVADMTSALADVRAALGAGATDADAIAAVWNYLDTRYTYTDVLINEAQAKLSIVYAQYLQSGGMALLDVTAKYTPDGGDAGNTPDRVQSLHDNILGNLGKVGLADKLGAGSDAYLRIEAAVGSDPVLSGLFNDRPVYGGYEGETNQSLAWDIAHGLYPGASGTLVASDVDTALSSLTWSDVTVGAAQYGSFTIDPSSGKWTYVLNPAAADALAAGDSVNEVFTVRVTDDHGAFDTTTVTVTIKGTNDAPVISGSTSASSGVSGLTGFVEADVASDNRFEPEFEVSGLQAIINAHPGDMDAVLDDVQLALGGADRATAIAHVWDNLDDHYASVGYYNTGVNVLFVQLGVEYAKYLQAGGTPLLDVVVKYAPDNNSDGIPQRLQSMHDNLLGNFDAVALADRFGSDPALLAELQNLIRSADPALLGRPAYSGNEGAANDALAWDQSHGFAPAQAGQMHASDVDAGADLTWSGGGTGTYGVFAIDPVSGKWTYTVDPAKPGFAALTQGQTANESFTVTVSDEHGAEDHYVLTVTATGINDAPVIGLGGDTGSVVERGGVVEVIDAFVTRNLEPSSSVASSVAGLLSGLETNGSTLEVVYGQVLSAVGGDALQAIAIVWDYLDDIYGSVGPNKVEVNEAFTRLGVVYAQHLQAGGAALLDVVAKYTPDGADAGSAPDRLQSLHDNLLGNINDYALTQRYVNATNDPVRYGTLRALIQSVDADLLARPSYSGNESDSDVATRSWDVGNGYAGPSSATGQLTATDVDPASSLTWSLDPGSAAGTYGTFGVNASGKWTYVLDDDRASTQGLAEGETKTETFTVRVTDDHGAFDTTTVTITVTGSNDAPVISGSTGASYLASGLTGFVEADAALDHKFEPTLNLDGVIAPLMVSGMDMSSVLDQVQTALGTGATRAQAIAQVWDYIDDHGGYYNNLLNEASARLAVEYAKYLRAGGTPLLDVVAKYAPDGTDLGSLPDRLQSLHDNLLGNVHGASLIDKMLGAGQGSNADPIADVYQNILSLLAANGLSGLLDRPIYSGNEGAANNALSWDQSHGFAPAQAGQMHASDVDAGADLTWSGGGTGTYGVFAIDPVSGKWTYTVDPAKPGFAALTQGQTANESFTVTVTDEFGAKDQHVLTVTATGINDAPVITGDASYTVTEDLSTDIDVLNRLVASGKLTVVDPDAGQSVFQTQTDSTQAYGTFSIDANGNWIYYADNDSAAIQGLAAGDSVSDVVTVLTADGTAQQITITIKGTNDAPVIAAVNPTEFSQNFDSDTSGMFYLGNGASYGGVAIVASGTNSITTADGSSYAVITDVSGAGAFTRFDGYQAVWPGDYTAEVKVYLDTSWSTGEGFDYSVASSDSSGGFLRDFIFHVTKDTSTGKLLVGGSNNTNFAPREDLETLNHYEVTQTGWYTLRHTFKDVGGVLTVDLQLVDANGTVLWTETRSNPADQIGVNVGGNRYGWFADITLPNGLAVDGVTLNRETADAVVVELADGNPNEGSAVHASSGTIAFGDVDVTDTHTVSAAPAGSGYVGAFTAVLSDDSTGDGTGAISWSFTVADAAIEHLAAGQTLDQVYTVTVTDSAGASDTVDITVTIMGTNDAPVITWNEAGHTSDPSFSFTEGSNSSHWLGAKLAFTDVDLNDTHTLEITPLTTTRPGNVFLGSYAPEVLDADGTGGGAGREVRFNFSVADSDLNFLGAGEVITQTYQVQLRDSAGAVSETRTIYVRFTGTNDAASIAIDTAVADDRSVTEAGGVANGTAGDPWASGKLLVTDVDSGQDAFAVPPNLNGTYGTFTFNAATGAWSYALDDARLATQGLMQGEMVSDTLTVTSLDGTASHNIVVNIAGTNDAPVITWNEAGHTSDPSFSFTEGSNSSHWLGAKLAFTDVDLNDTHTLLITPLTTTHPGNVFLGSYAPEVLDADGTGGGAGREVRFNFSVADSDLNFLGAGEVITQSYQVQLRDSTGAVSETRTIYVRFTGTNDVPVITGNISDTVTEDSSADIDVLNRLVASGKLTVVDPDAGQSVFQTQTDSVKAYGKFSIDADGNWVYYADNDSSAVQGLAGGSSVSDVVTVLTADGTAQQITVTINGTNDAPVVQDHVFTVGEDDTLSGTLATGATDVDNNPATLTYALVNPVDGLTLNANGTFSYSPPASYQSLNNGDTATVSFEYVANDGAVNSGAKTVTITIQGSNDAVFAPADASPIYAYSNNTQGAGFGQPTAISLNLATLFAAAPAGTTYSYAVLEGNWGWLTRTGDVLAGDPNTSQAGLYVAQVTATTPGGATETTLVGFMVLPDNSGYQVITANGQSVPWAAGKVVDLDDSVNVTSMVTGNDTDVMLGNDFNNNLNGNYGSDALFGGKGDDRLDGNSGIDFLSGGEGNDTLYSTTETGYLLGGSGNDTLYGGSNDDYLFGGTGDDIIYDGTGADILNGGAGNDVLYATGEGRIDKLTGGAGDDRFVMLGNDGDQILDYGNGNDVIDLTNLFTAGVGESATLYTDLSGSQLLFRTSPTGGWQVAANFVGSVPTAVNILYDDAASNVIQQTIT